MTRFLVHEAGEGRAIHALVVGVGDYPHLIGGTGDLTSSHGGMRQLTSPTISARAMAEWLTEGLAHPDFSRKTVALLLSEREPKPFANPLNGDEHIVQQANFANIRQAIIDWKERGSQSTDDMLILYFSGHGMSEGIGSMVILPSDFGADRHNAYDTSIDFVNLYDAMEQATASRQCYFVDACRSSTDTLPDNGGRKILQVGPREADGVRVAPVYYATLIGQDAHARPGKPSLFTGALLSCLSDFAATDDEGDNDWRVSNFSLSRALDHMMSRIEVDGVSLDQVPISGEVHSSFYIHHLANPPKANVYVSSEPTDLLQNLQLVCKDASGAQRERESTEDPEWALVVPSGKTTIEAIGQNDGVADPIKKSTTARPLFKRVKLP